MKSRKGLVVFLPYFMLMVICFYRKQVAISFYILQKVSFYLNQKAFGTLSISSARPLSLGFALSLTSVVIITYVHTYINGTMYKCTHLYLCKLYMYTHIYFWYNMIVKEYPKRSGVDVMAVSKAQQKATANYKAKNYDRIALEVKKGSKEQIKAEAEKHNESLNSYIKKAIAERYKEDTGKDIDV